MARLLSLILRSPVLEKVKAATASKAQRSPEQSWALRLSVQILVSVGMIATDVAAGTSNSAWAIPLSFIGSGWSWRNRAKPNTLAKFGIALGMLVVLALFLGQMLSQGNDTRILLAELLIQLQVLHTFDLPRRKDLGYSATIGLILLAVAATISETNFFGLFLFLFLTIAIPVLWLDYRSRIQVKSRKRLFQWAGIKRLGLLLTAITSLGLLIFAFMPRMPGYQLKMFPVSAAIDIQGEFDNQKIVNPGYVKPSQNAGKSSQGQTQGATFEDKTGEVGAGGTSSAYYGFNPEMDQTQSGIGKPLEPKEVMRVRTQAPGFWRVLAFDYYTGKGWKLAHNEQTKTIRRPSWSYRFFVPQQTSLSKQKEVVQTFSILSDLPNLIPALSSARHIYFPTREIAIDSEYGLRSPVPLEEGLTYTTVSDVAYRDRTTLKNAPVDYPKSLSQKYLQIPDAIAPRIREATETLLAKAEQVPTQPSEKALLLAQLLKQRYTIQLTAPSLEENQDLVESFLVEHQGGYPDQFSTALTVMLRSIGIPARLVTGFAPGKFNPFTGMYVVKNTDAFALTEVYIPKYGWFTFDPIPGHPLIPPSIEENERFPLLSQLWHWAAGWFPSPLKNSFNQLWLVLATLVGGLFGLVSQGWYGFGILLFMGVAIAFLGWGLWHLKRVLRHRHQFRQLEPMEQLYRQMLDTLEKEGYAKDAAMTPLEFTQFLEQEMLESNLTSIKAISKAYIQWRYGQQAQNLDYLRQQLNGLQKQSSQHSLSKPSK